MKIKIYLSAFLSVILLSAKAQLNPLGAVYYQNQFLANPAMAGIEQGLNVNAGFKAQWLTIEGSPKMQYFTADYGLNKSVGLGATVYNESAGVINRFRATLTYAYHLPLSQEDHFIDFGLSAGIMNENINMNKARADFSDDVISSFNDRQLYLDGDFGVAYRNKNLTLQATLPNMKRLFKRDVTRYVVDRSLYFLAAGYNFNLNQVISSIEPKLVFRGVQNYQSIVDAGINFRAYENKIMLSGVYHSSNSFTGGISFIYQNQLSLLLQYTTNTSQMQQYSNGEFEVGLKYSVRH